MTVIGPSRDESDSSMAWLLFSAKVFKNGYLSDNSDTGFIVFATMLPMTYVSSLHIIIIQQIESI